MLRQNLSTDTPWEPKVGYSRAVRMGDRIFVTGTVATGPHGGRVGEGDAYAQAVQCLENIHLALKALGGTIQDIVRTRIYVTDIERDWQDIGLAHSEVLGEVRPATSMVEVRRLIEDWMLVEIEADAWLGVTAVRHVTLGDR